MESDRMGYLLPALDQKRLDLQRGVVQNEKRQDDNQPEGLVEYAELENLFPVGHPYHHTTIGSMTDLDRASLADVKQWFIDKYGPNNAVVALAGDITPGRSADADGKVFRRDQTGAGQRAGVRQSCQRSRRPEAIMMKDRVAATDVQLYWAVPGDAFAAEPGGRRSAHRSSAASAARASTGSSSAARRSPFRPAPTCPPSTGSACSRSARP